MGKLVYPFALNFLQSLLQSIYNNFICGFHLAIALRVGWGGVSVLYAQITTISLEGPTIKLKHIIRDDSVRDPESFHDILPYKSLHILILDICKRLDLYPFGEVISSDEKISLIPYSLTKWAINI